MRPLLVLTLLCTAVNARAATSCHLSYGNGALIPNVKVVVPQ